MLQKILELNKKYDELEIKVKNAKKIPQWYIQPIETLHHGPESDVNQVIRNLIDEGFKRIMLITCNPGHHQLAPDIKAAKGVVVQFAENTLYG